MLQSEIHHRLFFWYKIACQKMTDIVLCWKSVYLGQSMGDRHVRRFVEHLNHCISQHSLKVLGNGTTVLLQLDLTSFHLSAHYSLRNTSNFAAKDKQFRSASDSLTCLCVCLCVSCTCTKLNSFKPNVAAVWLEFLRRIREVSYFKVSACRPVILVEVLLLSSVTPCEFHDRAFS
jgi:hypothetical protein